MGKFFIGILAVCLMLVFATGVDQWLITLREIRYAGVVGFIVCSFPVLFCVMVAGADGLGEFKKVFLKLYWPLAILALMVVIWAFFNLEMSMILPNIALGPIFNLWTILVIFLTYYYLGESHVRWASLAAIAVIGVGVAYEVKNPGYFSVDPSRAAGFSLNPNTTCERLTLLLPFALPYERRTWMALPVMLGAFAIAFLTQSRGGILMIMAISVLYYILGSLKRGLSPTKLAVFLVGFVMMAVAGYATLSMLADSSFLADNPYAQRRLKMIMNPSLEDVDNDSRAELARDYFDKAMEQPVTGYGTAASMTMENFAHNMLLRFFFENGIFAVLFYVWFVISGILKSWKVRSLSATMLFLTILMNSVFTHNMTENRTFGVALAFAGLSYLWSERKLIGRMPINRDPASLPA